MRTKSITLDGITFTIASLTYGYIRKWREERQTVAQVIQHSLNAALPEGDQNRWTPERFEAEFDPFLADGVYKEILEFSGLPEVYVPPNQKLQNSDKAEEDSGPGEKPAAASTTISTT